MRKSGRERSRSPDASYRAWFWVQEESGWWSWRWRNKFWVPPEQRPTTSSTSTGLGAAATEQRPTTSSTSTGLGAAAVTDQCHAAEAQPTEKKDDNAEAVAMEVYSL